MWSSCFESQRKRDRHRAHDEWHGSPAPRENGALLDEALELAHHSRDVSSRGTVQPIEESPGSERQRFTRRRPRGFRIRLVLQRCSCNGDQQLLIGGHQIRCCAGVGDRIVEPLGTPGREHPHALQVARRPIPVGPRGALARNVQQPPSNVGPGSTCSRCVGQRYTVDGLEGIPGVVVEPLSGEPP